MEAFLLIPDPAEISEKRFKRNAYLRGLSSSKLKEINISHKFDNLLKECEKISVKCIDFRDDLRQSDYYVYDNHLNKSGVNKLVKSLFY